MPKTSVAAAHSSSSSSSNGSQCGQDDDDFFQALCDRHSQECDSAEAADAVRDVSSDTEDGPSCAAAPTWWSELIMKHTTGIKVPEVHEDRPIRAMSACTGTCPEAAVFEVTCLDF